MEYILLIVCLIVFMLFFVWQNNSIVVTKMNYKNKKIPKEFNGLKILHISDFHNKKFGKNYKRIIKKIKEINPNIVLITGDTIDCHFPKPDRVYYFFELLTKIFPVYLVSGNHEHVCGRYDEFIKGYKNAGVHILDDTFVEIEKNNEKLKILGISDLTGNIRARLAKKQVKLRLNTSELCCYISAIKENVFGYISDNSRKVFEEKIKNVVCKCNKNEFCILLAHRPELINLYEKYNIDLVLSGHAHGGQFRFLGIKGIIAPGQGIFPKYTSGLYRKKNTSMIVSRGLGNSVIPIRIFNRPELVVIDLEK